MKLVCFLGIAALTAMLQSCGGGGDGTSAALPPAPSSGPPLAAPGIALLAGNIGGPGFVDAAGTAARFERLNGQIAADPAGNVYVVDSQLLRRIARDGTVTTLAGKRNSAKRIDGKGDQASFGSVTAVTADAAGNVYLIDTEGGVPPLLTGFIRKVTPDGTVTTLPNSDKVIFFTRLPVRFPIFAAPTQVAVDSTGAVYTVGTGGDNLTVWKLSATGEVTQLPEPAGALAIDSADNLYIANYTDHTVRRRTPDGQSAIVITDPLISTATSAFVGTSSESIAAAGPRSLFVNTGFAVSRFDPVTGGRFDSVAATASLTVGDPQQPGTMDGPPPPPRLSGTPIAADNQGNVYQVGDLQVRKITPGGAVFPLAGAGPLLAGYADDVGSAARFRNPVDLAPDGKGNIYVADSGPKSLIRKIDPFGRVTTFAGNDQLGGSDDGPATQANFQDLLSIRVGPSGTVYVLQGNHRLRRISTDGVVTTTILPNTFSAGCAADFVVDAQENLYFSCAVLLKMTPTGVVSAPWNPGVDLGLGGPLVGALANVSAASNTIYHQPSRLAIDADGNLYGLAAGDPIMKFRTDGVVVPLANSETTNRRGDIAFDPEGNLYVTEFLAVDTDSNPGSPGLIRKITPAGAVTVAGTPGVFGTVLGNLPGALNGPHGMRFIGPKTLVVAVGAGVLKIVVP